ncbi:MAG: hypothetical protein GYA24_14835 [Candidatus Lokiarchaeota archaeon]|nr:hypothetical protein [Candidatus Lokiarchaeota archaeon]
MSPEEIPGAKVETPSGGAPSPEGITNEEIWQNIGFHRPLAGFFYNLVFMFFGLFFGIFVGGYLYNLMYPFPESLGYKTAATAMFGLFFQVWDLGTANVVNRYLGENSVKNPQKMIKVVQYFIWYQSITGLVQVTWISIYALYFVPATQLAYGVWIMVIFSTVQYPGYLWIFKDILGSLQQFHRTNVLNFLTGDIIQRVIEILFVLLGRWYGQGNPAVGEIMGIAIGSIIGTYVDDFLSMVVCAYFFKKALRQYDIKIRDCFRHDFDRKLVKEILVFGLKTGIPHLFWPAVTLYATFLWITLVPQYTTFVTIAGFAGSFGSLVSTNLDLGGAISESFLNDKKQLARYYIAQAWRFIGFMQLLMSSITIIIIFIYADIVAFVGLQYYIAGAVFILPRMVRELQQPYNNVSEAIITQTNHPNISFWMHLLEDILALVGWFVFIFWLQLPQRYGMIAIAWLIPCGEMPAICTKVIINYILINKRIIKLKFALWQTFVAPAIASGFVLAIALLVYNLAYLPIRAVAGPLPAVIAIALFGILIVPFFIYTPLTAFFGGWDDASVNFFQIAARISGPSRFIAIPMANVLKWAARHSPLHNRFKFDNEGALREARELMAQKNQFQKEKVKIL